MSLTVAFKVMIFMFVCLYGGMQNGRSLSLQLYALGVVVVRDFVVLGAAAADMAHRDK